MKIIRDGQAPAAKRAPWWVGKIAECKGCGCQAELALEDAVGLVNEHAERHPGGRQWVEIPCPTVGCGGKLTLQNMDANKPPGWLAAREFNPPPAKP